MLYQLVRALLASFLPLLPMIFRSGKLSDWTRSLAGNFHPQYLSPSRSTPNNISIGAQNLAHGLDNTLTIDSLALPGVHIHTSHPFFEAFTTTIHHIFLRAALPSFWQLLELLVLLIPLVIWAARLASVRLSAKRVLPSEQPANIPLLEAQDCGANATKSRCLIVFRKPYESPYSDVQVPLPTSDMLSPSPSLSSSSSVPVSPSTTDFVSQLLLPWYDEEEVQNSVPLSGELQRSRSLSDIVEQTEFEDSDVEPHDGAPCEWFSGSPGRMQSTPQGSPSSSHHSTPSLADVTLIGALVSREEREDYTPLALPEEMAVPDLASFDDFADTTLSYTSPDSAVQIQGDPESSATRPPGLRSRRASSVCTSFPSSYDRKLITPCRSWSRGSGYQGSKSLLPVLVLNTPSPSCGFTRPRVQQRGMSAVVSIVLLLTPSMSSPRAGEISHVSGLRRVS